MGRSVVKPYGLPRLPGNGLGDHGDIEDIQTFARKSSVGRVKGPVEYKSYTRSAKARQATRRMWKKKERQKAKMREEVQNAKPYTE